jgi:hypothetical protein
LGEVARLEGPGVVAIGGHWGMGAVGARPANPIPCALVPGAGWA